MIPVTAMKHLPFTTVVVGLALFTSSADGVTFSNGSFENLTSSYANIAMEDRDDNAASDGWDISSESPDWMWGEGPESRWNTPWGDHFVLGAANSTGFREGVSQSVSGFTVGASYELTFSHANGLYYTTSMGYEGVGRPGGWEVKLDGVTLTLADSANAISSVSLEHTSDWFTREIEFVALQETIEFEFLAYLNPQVSGQGATFQYLDNVSVTGVPEPSLGLLAAIGILLSCGRRR